MTSASPGPTPRTGSWGLRQGDGYKRANAPGIIERLFDRWLAEAKAGDRFAYWRGSVAADKVHDPHLARLADRLLELSDGRFDVQSSCGHIRGEIIGEGSIQLLTKRDHGETVYLAQKR